MNTPQFWKDELNREDRQLGKLLDSVGPERLVAEFVAVERFAFLTAYIVRMLAEADELSEELIRFKWPAQAYPCIRMPPHRNWFMVSEAGGKNPRQPLGDYYDLERPTEQPLLLMAICNGLVHPFAFEVRLGHDDIEILFNSNQTKRTKRLLFLVALTTYRGLVGEVASDEIGWVDENRYRAKRPVKRYRRRPPDAL